jgi:hypothetical protein
VSNNCDIDEDNDNNDASNTGQQSGMQLQSIYGRNDDNAVVQTFANLITLEVGDSNWRLVVDAAFQALKMKGREQWSIFSDQKFEGLNYRWFGCSKAKGVDKNCRLTGILQLSWTRLYP